METKTLINKEDYSDRQKLLAAKIEDSFDIHFWMITNLNLKKIDLLLFAYLYKHETLRSGAKDLMYYFGASKDTFKDAIYRLEKRGYIKLDIKELGSNQRVYDLKLNKTQVKELLKALKLI